jgi:hypothetical protein
LPVTDAPFSVARPDVARVLRDVAPVTVSLPVTLKVLPAVTAPSRLLVPVTVRFEKMPGNPPDRYCETSAARVLGADPGCHARSKSDDETDCAAGWQPSEDVAVVAAQFPLQGIWKVTEVPGFTWDGSCVMRVTIPVVLFTLATWIGALIPVIIAIAARVTADRLPGANDSVLDGK